MASASPCKQVSPVALAAWLILFCGGVAAQELKIGYVDSQRLAEAAPQIMAARSELDQEFRDRQARMRAREDELNQLVDRSIRDRDLMSDSEQLAIERQIESLRREIVRSREDLRYEATFRANEELVELEQQIEETVAQIGREQGLDLILRYTSVYYASERIDLTDAVLERLQADFSQPAAEDDSQ